MKRTVNISEMARICNVSSETIRRWVDRGAIPAIKTRGGHRRIDYKDFLDFLERKGICPDSENGGSKKSVLLIGEDSKYLEEEILNDLLIPPSVSLEFAKDSFEAGYKLAVMQPDIIVVDPGSNGLDLQQMTEVIRKDPYTRHSSIFILCDRRNNGTPWDDSEGLESIEINDLADKAKLEDLLYQ